MDTLYFSFSILHLVNHVKIRSEGRKRMRHGLALCQDRKGMLCVRLQLHFLKAEAIIGKSPAVAKGRCSPNRRCTHFHSPTGLAGFADTRIDDDSQIDFINQYLDKLLGCQTLVEANREKQRGTLAAPALTRSRAVFKSGVHIKGMTTNPSLARISVARMVS